MGTRHYQSVIKKDGEVVLKQYCQWDGHPESQGVEVLNYLRNGDLSKYYKNLKNLRVVTEEEIKEITKHNDWMERYPYLSRDCGADIHQMIEDGVVKFVQHMEESEAEQCCEGFYTIDFMQGTEGMFFAEYHGVCKAYALCNLPTPEEFIKDMYDEED